MKRILTTIIPVRPQHLTAKDWADWTRLQQSNPALEGPYFRPEFTRAVAAVRDDVEVALLKQDGQTVGFFPYQRGRWNLGQPVGGRLSDFHGVIAAPDTQWNAEELVRGCRLASWNFDHLVAAQQSFRPWYRGVADSPYLDLTDGFAAYEADRRRAGSGIIKQTARKARKFQATVGPLHFERHTTDRRLFETLIRWKTAQYRRTGVTNVFRFPWTVALLEKILQRQTDEFSAMMSTLSIGGRLVAIHLGMRSHGVLHCWFPAYDRDFARYSPGMILILEMARAAESLGIRRIDLGKGPERYKISLASGSLPVAEGAVQSKLVGKMVDAGWHRTRAWLMASPLGNVARMPAECIRPVREWLAYL